MNRIRRHMRLCWMALLALTACDVRNPAASDALPVLSSLMVPSALYLLSDIPYPVTVDASDPQGVEDIGTVLAVIKTQAGVVVWQDSLRDDGRGGDVISGDGRYFAALRVGFASGLAGLYPIQVSAVDRSGNPANSLCDTLVVLDGVINAPPLLMNPVLPDSVTQANLDSVTLHIKAVDPDGVIDSVTVQVFPGISPVPVFSGALRDDGSGADAAAGDSVYSGLFDLAGRLTMPPSLSALTAPDTVSRGPAIPFVISVRAEDPNGPGDIRVVYFNSYKPDGSPSNGNPFPLYDDGNVNAHGDQVPGDGLYSIIIQISAQNATGAYRFEFFAEDYAVSIDQVVFRFQATDSGGASGFPKTAVVPSRLNTAPADPLVHIITVVN